MMLERWQGGGARAHPIYPADHCKDSSFPQRNTEKAPQLSGVSAFLAPPQHKTLSKLVLPVPTGVFKLLKGKFHCLRLLGIFHGDSNVVPID